MGTEVRFNPAMSANAAIPVGQQTQNTSKPSIFANPTANDKGQNTYFNKDFASLKNFDKKELNDFINTINNNIEKLANNPKVKEAIEKYKDTPLYDEIQKALQGNEQAILNVLSDKNIQKDIEELLKDEDVQNNILDIAPSDDMKNAVKDLLNDKEIKKQVFEIINGKNIDKNVKEIMENPNGQSFVKSIINNPEIKELIKSRTIDFPLKSRLFDSLDNPIVQFGLIKTIMSNEVVQKTIADLIKSGNENSLNSAVVKITESLSKSDNFINSSATLMQTGLMGGLTAGAAAGDVVGSYVPIIGRPVFSILGAIIGTALGGIAGGVSSIGRAVVAFFR